MNNKIHKYLEILKIELKDLIEDLEFSEDVLAKRFKEHEITEYVFMENIGLLKKEILGIEKVKRMIEASAKDDLTIKELRELIETYFSREISTAGLPNVVMLLVTRKLDKIDKYIRMGE